MEKISVGDLVQSIAGRDEGNIFLVIKTEGKFAYVADGKIRKVQNIKKKNIKHLKSVETAKAKVLAERINSGEPVSNEKLKMVCAKKI